MAKNGEIEKAAREAITAIEELFGTLSASRRKYGQNAYQNAKDAVGNLEVMAQGPRPKKPTSKEKT